MFGTMQIDTVKALEEKKIPKKILVEAMDKGLIGKEFGDAVQLLAKRRGILLGFETDDSKEVRKKLSKDVLHEARDGTRLIVINPQSHYKIRRGDALFLIAETRPTKL